MVQWWMWLVAALGFAGSVLFTVLRPGRRSGQGIETTLDGAKLAISHLLEYAKWIAGIQITALGALGYLVFSKDVRALTSGPWAVVSASAAFVYLGLSLGLSAVLLFSLPSIALRIHRVAYFAEGSDPRNFDVLEMPIYTWLPVKLVAGTTFHACLWIAGLLYLGGLVLRLLF